MPPDEPDDTRSALAALRELPAERAADEAAERAASETSHAAQAARALAILDERRPRTLDDRRAIGLPASLEDDHWFDAVLARLDELDADAVLDAWLDLVEADGGGRVQAAAAAALSRIPSVRPLVDRLHRILRETPVDQGRHARDALVASQVPIDPALLGLVRGLLVDPDCSRETANAAVALAGALARREHGVAAMIAERARIDRVRWRQELFLPLTTSSRTADSAYLAEAVERSCCPALAATAMLELESRRSSLERWAKALLAVAGESGRAHLVRMRGRPGWSDLVAPTDPMPDGLDALVSPITDIRRQALAALADEPRPERLRALLLATELDRHVVKDVLRDSWTAVRPTAWFPLLVAHGPASELDKKLVGDPDLPGFDSPEELAVAQRMFVHGRAEELLVEIVEAGAARGPMKVEQELTPTLRELEADGPIAFAAKHMPDPRLTADELAALDAAEAELAASAARWWD